MRGEVDIVKTDDRDIFRNSDASFHQTVHRACCDVVVGCEDRISFRILMEQDIDRAVTIVSMPTCLDTNALAARRAPSLLAGC